MSDSDNNSNFVDRLPLAPERDEDGFAPSFDVTDEEALRDFFNEFGFVVVRDVLPAGAAEATRAELFARIGPPVDEAAIDKFVRAQRFRFAGIVGMIPDITSVSMLRNRLAPAVQAAHAAVYGTDNLIVDHDRLGAMRPTRRSDGSTIPDSKTIDGWLHLDSNPCSGLVSLFSFENGGHRHDWSRTPLTQGLIALTDAKEEDGGFVCVPGSHKISKEWTIANGWQAKEPQLRVPPDDALRDRQVSIPLREGSLLIWSAWLLHANAPNHSTNWRICQYVRQFPRELCDYRPLVTSRASLPPEIVKELDERTIKLLGLED